MSIVISYTILQVVLGSLRLYCFYYDKHSLRLCTVGAHFLFKESIRMSADIKYCITLLKKRGSGMVQSCLRQMKNTQCVKENIFPSVISCSAGVCFLESSANAYSQESHFLLNVEKKNKAIFYFTFIQSCQEREADEELQSSEIPSRLPKHKPYPPQSVITSNFTN